MMVRRSIFLLGVCAAALAPWAAAAQDQLPVQAPPGVEAAEQDAEAGEEDIPEDILVTGARERGSVPGDIQPELQLRAGDIRSYGVSNLTELLTELAPQLDSARGREGGRPVVLLNGRRISGFGEIRDLPTEAIERVDILPEEASLRLGYRADQRVVNFVLRRRFNAYTGELQASGTTAGGRYTGAADANLLRIARDKRLSINLHADAATGLFEADRDIIPVQGLTASRPLSIEGNITAPDGRSEIDPALSAIAGRPVTVAGVPVGPNGTPTLTAFELTPWTNDMSAYRTLQAPTRKVSGNATYSQTILGNVTASVNASYEANASDSRLGLYGTSYRVPESSPFSPFSNDISVNRYLVEAGPRIRDVNSGTAHLGVALNGDIAAWRWSFTSNYDRSLSRTLTDTTVDFAPVAARIAAGDPAINPFLPTNGLLGGFRQDFARALTDRFDAEMVASGPLFTLPAGKVNASLKSGFESSELDARAVRLGTESVSNSSRRTGSMQASVDVPIASRRTGFLSAIGNLTLNGNVAVDQVSYFGRLMTYGAGLNWSPIQKIRVNASMTEEEGAPSVAQLGNPVIVTPEARYFDFVRGESVDVTRIDGGNPALLADSRRVMKLGVNVRPFDEEDLSLSANYVTTRTLNPIQSIAVVTPAIEAAFPDRFLRDASGQLTRVDNRPVNFERRDESQLRWGMNFSKRLGPPPPQRGAGGGGGFRRPGNGSPGSGWRRPSAEAPDAVQAAPAPAPTSDVATINAQDAPTTDAPTSSALGVQAEQRVRPGGAGGPGGGGRGFSGGRGGFGRFGGGERINVSLYHTWRFQDALVIRPGVPTLDLLDGFALGSRGGQPRHALDLQAGYTKNWFGMRATAKWEAGTTVRGGTRANAPTDIDFAPLTTLSLRVFANFTPGMPITREHPWLRGTRVSLNIRNLFDAKPKVTDATGNTPLNYQPNLLDPTGRTISVSIRKLFF